MEYVDGMSLYRAYFVPGGFDPLGLEWKIHRNGGAKASAVPSDRNDTISDLAKLIGLCECEASDWLTITNDNGMPLPNVNDPIGWVYCDLPKFEVPSTMVTIWAGELGFLGRFAISFGSEEEYLKELGFKVSPISKGHPNAQLGPFPMSKRWVYPKLEKTSSDKELHGIYGWGHGGTTYFGFGSRIDGLGRVAQDYDMKYYYHEIEKKIKYHLALTVINACHSKSGAGKLTANPNGIFDGHSGVLDPTGTNILGDSGIIWLKDVIKPGEQGTRGGK